MNSFGSRIRKVFTRKPPAGRDEAADGAPGFLLVGLGNPGREYRHTRHNVGFMVIDRLAQETGIGLIRVQQKAITGMGMLGEHKVLLAKPQTFMNLSGESVGGLARFYKIAPEKVIVTHDDLDLPFGTLRLRPGGGSAGQKGIQSIITRLGTQEFPRLRFGIGRPPGSKHGASYVLHGFSAVEQKELDFLLSRAAEALRTFVNEGLEMAMNRYNGAHLEE
ncbi:MAG: aminoacyl-tRNA hydrolase [Chloroflexota bacterium]